METRRIIGLLSVVSITVLLLAAQSDALLYKAWSKLCFEGALKAGMSAGTLEWTLDTATVECMCINEQTGKFDAKPGQGNLGEVTENFAANENADRDRRFVYVNGCIEDIEEQFTLFENHYNPDGTEAAGHVCEGGLDDCRYHVCNASQSNKIELQNTCLFNEFIANWKLYDLNGNLKLTGKDTCVWRGARNADGTPTTTNKNCETCSLLDGTCDSECTWACDEQVTKPKGGSQ